MLALSNIGTKIFSNAVGVGWLGKLAAGGRDGGIFLKCAHRIKFGLFKGSHDKIGFHPMVIKPHHVGRTIGVFVSMEIKRPGQKLRPEQEVWYQVCEQSGCIVAMVTCPEDAVTAVERFIA